MANNNYKVIRAHELLPHEKRSVEDDFSHLSLQELDRLAPSALNGQKLKSGLEKGEYLLLSDSPVKPRYPMKAKPRPGGSGFSSLPPPTIDETYTPEPVLPDPPKNKPLLYQYCIEMNCRWQTFRRYRGGSFTLAKTGAEVSRSISVKAPQANGRLRCYFFCAEPEPKKLQQRTGDAPYPFYYVDNVMPVPEGSARPREAFLLVTPMVEWHGKLAYATEGYYYYFRDTRLMAEYQLAGNGIPLFRATLSGANGLSDTLAGQSTSAIMLYWREHGRIVNNQYLVYRQQKLTADELAQVDESWLAENGINVDVEQALAAVEAGAQAKADVSLPYHHLTSVQYDHPQNTLPGSPDLYPNRRDATIAGIELPVMKVASLTPEPNWIALDIEGAGGADYQIQRPDRAVIRLDPHGIAGTKKVYNSPQITGTLDSEGKARVELPDEFADTALEIKILLPQDWSAVWMNLWAGVQLVSGAVTLTFAGTMEVGSFGTSTLISLGLAVWSVDQMYAASQTLVNQQQTGTQAAALFEWAGVPAEYSELAAGALPLGGMMVKGLAKMTINNPAIRSVTINAIRQGDKLVHRSIEFIAERVKHRYVFRRAAGTLEEAKGTSNLKYVDYIGDGRPVSGHTGYLGSPRLTRSELLQYRSELRDIGIKFERNADRYIDSIRPGARGGFDYTTGTVYLRRGTTRYEAFHEFTHAKQFSSIGQEAYINLGTYSRESHVFNEVFKNRHSFTKAEMDHAVNYMRDLRWKHQQGLIK